MSGEEQCKVTKEYSPWLGYWNWTGEFCAVME